MNNKVTRVIWAGMCGLLLSVSAAAQDSTAATTRQAMRWLPASQPATRPAAVPVEQSGIDAVTLITLHAQDVPLRTVLAELSAQTGLDIGLTWGADAPGNELLVSIDAGKRPFWPTLYEVCRRTNCSPEYSADPRRIPIKRFSQPTDRPFSSHQSAVVTATRLTQLEVVDLVEPRKNVKQMVVSMQMFVDPKLTILNCDSVALDQMTNRPNELSISAGGMAAFAVGRGWEWGLQVPVEIQSPADRNLQKLRGTVRLTVKTKSEQWVIDRPLDVNGVERLFEKGNWKVRFDGLTQDKGKWKVQINVSGPNAYWTTRSEALAHMLRLTDAEGRAYRFSGRITSTTSGYPFENHSISFVDPQSKSVAIGPPAKLVVDVPTEWRDILIPVSLDHIPMTEPPADPVAAMPPWKPPVAGKPATSDGPTLVTVQARSKPGEEVVADLAAQAKATILRQPEELGMPPVTGDWKSKPFWTALRDICGQTGWQPTSLPFTEGITLTPQLGRTLFTARPWSAHGSFPATIIRVTRREEIDYDNPQHWPREFSVGILVLTEAKDKVLTCLTPAEVDRAVDVYGTVLNPKPGRQSYAWTGSASCWGWYAAAPLDFRRDCGTRLAEFKGRVRLQVQTQSELWQIDNPLKAAVTERTFGKAQFRFVSLTKLRDLAYELRLNVQSKEPSPALWGDLLLKNACLTDSEGRPFIAFNPGSMLRGDRSITFGIRGLSDPGRPRGDPTKLTIEVPTEAGEITVPFEFKDVPLP